MVRRAGAKCLFRDCGPADGPTREKQNANPPSGERSMSVVALRAPPDKRSRRIPYPMVAANAKARGGGTYVRQSRGVRPPPHLTLGPANPGQERSGPAGPPPEGRGSEATNPSRTLAQMPRKPEGQEGTETARRTQAEHAGERTRGQRHGNSTPNALSLKRPQGLSKSTKTPGHKERRMRSLGVRFPAPGSLTSE